MNILNVFGKAPVEGRVKTRLGVQIGQKHAANLYACFLKDSLKAYQLIRNVYINLYITPESIEYLDQIKPFNQLFHNQEIQTGKDLGERMGQSVQNEIQKGPVIVVGSDLPTLPVDYIQMGFDYLRQEPGSVVIGPSDDGGYYLIGMNEYFSDLFKLKRFSTPSVFEETMNIVSQYGIPNLVLPQWYDIDEPSDLLRLVAELSENLDLAKNVPLTYHYLKSFPEIIHSIQL